MLGDGDGDVFGLGLPKGSETGRGRGGGSRGRSSSWLVDLVGQSGGGLRRRSSRSARGSRRGGATLEEEAGRGATGELDEGVAGWVLAGGLPEPEPGLVLPMPQPATGLFPGSLFRTPVTTSSTMGAMLHFLLGSLRPPMMVGHLSMPESPASQPSMIAWRVGSSQAAMKSPWVEKPVRSPLERMKGWDLPSLVHRSLNKGCSSTPRRRCEGVNPA